MPGKRFADGAYVCRSGSAAATDGMGSSGVPAKCKLGKLRDIGRAVPAAVLGVPELAGVGVDDNGFGGGGSRFSNEPVDELRCGAVYPYSDDLGDGAEKSNAFGKAFAAGDVRGVFAGEGNPG